MIPAVIPLQMADRVIALTSSCMHLATDELAERVVDEAGQGRLRKNHEGASVLAEPDTFISYFTIPNHLLIDLWAVDIPKLVGQTASGQRSGDVANWTNQDTLPTLLSAAYSEFAQVSQVVFHVSDGTRMGNGAFNVDLGAILAEQATIGELPSDTLIAVLNIDDQSLFVDIVSKPELNGSGNAGQAGVSPESLGLEIKPSEAIIWADRKINIIERSCSQTVSSQTVSSQTGSSQAACAKLLIRGPCSGTIERSAKA